MRRRSLPCDWARGVCKEELGQSPKLLVHGMNGAQWDVIHMRSKIANQESPLSGPVFTSKIA